MLSSVLLFIFIKPEVLRPEPWTRIAPLLFRLILPLYVWQHKSLTAILVRRKLPLSHWFSLEIRKERRAQVRPTCPVPGTLKSHGQNLRSTPGQAEPLAQYLCATCTFCFPLSVLIQ
jgi:hypothetical protein